MYSFLNRISWFLAFALAFGIIGIFDIWYKGLSIILVLILSPILKGIFLNAGTIKNLVEELENKIKNNFSEASEFSKNEEFKSNNISVIKKDFEDFNIPKIEKVLEKENHTENNSEKKGIISESKKEILENTVVNSGLNSLQEDENLNLSNSSKNQNIYTSISSIGNEEESEKIIPRKPNIFQKFFAENALAKVGGIFLFLGALFFIISLYNALDSMGKIILSFIFSATFYVVGNILLKKKGLSEGYVLMGLGIAINFLVILSGRFLLEGFSDIGTFFSANQTFIFLVGNGIFSIFTSLFHKSNNLLLFSFVLSYIIPFTIGDQNLNAFTLMFYNLVLTISAYGISYLYTKKEDFDLIKYLLQVGFIGGNFLNLFVSVGETGDNFLFITKIISTTLISIFPILINKGSINAKEILSYSGIGYGFLFISILGKNPVEFLENIYGFFGILIMIITISICSLIPWLNENERKNLTEKDDNLIIFSTVSPFAFMLGILGIFGIFLGEIPFFFFPTIFVLMIGYTFLVTLFDISKNSKTKFVIYAIFGFFLFFFTISITDSENILKNNLNILFAYFAIFGLFLACIYKSFEEKYKDSYLIGIAGFAILSSFVFFKSFVNEIYSLVSLTIFFLISIGSILFNKNIYNNSSLGVAGVYVTAIFTIIESTRLTIFLTADKTLDGFINNFALVYGILVLIFALISGIFFIKNKLNLEKLTNYNSFESIFLAFSSVTISLSFPAIGFIFKENFNLVIFLYFLISLGVFFLASKIKNEKILNFGFLTLIASVGFLIIEMFSDLLEINHFGDLTFYLIILAILFCNIILFKKFSEKEEYKLDALLQISNLIPIGLIALFINYSNIFYSLEWISFSFILNIVILCLSFIYRLFGTKFTNSFFNFVLIGSLFIGFLDLTKFTNSWQDFDISKLWIHFINLIILIGSLGIFYKTSEKKKLLIGFGFLFFFVNSSIILKEFFDNSFALTLYWGILFFICTYFGILGERKEIRSLGTLLFLLVTGKILVYDIWDGIENSALRVVAFMAVGAISIFVSTLYSKRKDMSFAEDFKNLINFFSEEKDKK